MKKRLPVVLILIMLLTACLSTASPKADPMPEPTEADAPSSGDESAEEVRMLNDLVGYIYQSESLYKDVQWVLDSFETFDEERSWKSLQLARASLAIARMDIVKRNLPEKEMTPEDQMELMRRGMDFSLMENLDALFDADRTTLLNICTNLHAGIMAGVFLRDDWDICMQHVSIVNELLEDDIQFLAHTADWVLATLNDPHVTGQFHGVMEEYCPLTRARQAEVPEGPEAIEEMTDRLLDRIDSLLIDEAKVSGARQHRFNVLKDLVKQSNFTAIGENLLEISDMPFTIFFPVWYDDQNILYFWEENGEILRTPAPGTALERAPDGCRIRISGVAKDAVLDYQEELAAAGLSCLGSQDSDGKLSLLYQCGDSSFALIWEENEITMLMMDQPVCMVPRWYLPAWNAIHP